MRMRTRTSHYSLDRYHYYPLGGTEEVQCKDRGAEVQTKYVQMFSREVILVQEVQRMCKVQRWCRGAEVQRCRGAEVQRSRGPEVQRSRGPEVQRRKGAKVQMKSAGADKV
jgi:hypothetical protein